VAKTRELEAQVARGEVQLRLFQKVSRLIAKAPVLRQALDSIAGQAAEYLHADSCLLYLLSGDQLVLCAARGANPAAVGQVRLRLSEGLTGWVARERRLLAISREAYQDPRFKNFRDLPEDRYEAFLSAPLIARNRVVGVINLQHQQPHSHSGDELEMLTTLGEQAGALAVLSATDNDRLDRLDLAELALGGAAPAVREQPGNVKASVAVALLLACGRLDAQSNSPRTAAPAWKSLYFYDEDFSTLTLHDIHYPSARCLFALGTQITKGRGKSVSLRSADNGKSWTVTPLKVHGRSAFFASDRIGWMVTEDGLERTGDCGATWEKLGRQKGLVRAWFRDEALGWAVGGPKKALATRDGGRTWTEIKPENNPKTDADRTVYGWVEFANDNFGIIAGWHQPNRPRSTQFPLWMDPESAQYRRQWPSLTLMLQSLDGGAQWKGFTASLMGRMTRVRLAPNGKGLALIEFDESFDYPSEVYRMGVSESTVARIYRDKHHAVSDLAMSPQWTYLAGTVTQGSVRLPLPGKLKMLRSQDLVRWTEDPADYRATAGRVHLAVGPGGQAVAATDTGMILRLE
jgi:hypothetical protein